MGLGHGAGSDATADGEGSGGTSRGSGGGMTDCDKAGCGDPCGGIWIGVRPSAAMPAVRCGPSGDRGIERIAIIGDEAGAGEPRPSSLAAVRSGNESCGRGDCEMGRRGGSPEADGVGAVGEIVGVTPIGTSAGVVEAVAGSLPITLIGTRSPARA